MNEELKKLAADALRDLLETAIQVKDFTVAQAPDVIRQLLAWNFAISLLQTILTTLFFGGVILFGVHVLRKKPFQDHENFKNAALRDFPSIISGALSIVFSATILLISAADSDWIWLKIWVAPKLFLIEYAASFVE